MYLITSRSTIPALLLEENGVALPGGPAVEIVGSGMLGSQFGTFWRLTLGIDPPNRTTLLSPSSSYVLKTVNSGIETTLTQFTTAAMSYDKGEGQAPVLTELRLWRVHYPADQIGGGGCVFSEHVGYLDLNYQDGSLPDTPAEEVVAVIQLSSRTTGGLQSFVFAGGLHFQGASAWDSATQSVIDVPEGGLPDPNFAQWMPALEPDAEYCAIMFLRGRLDRGMPGVVSNQVCAKVRNMDATSSGGGGCSFGGRTGTSGSAVAVFALLGLALFRARRRCAR